MFVPPRNPFGGSGPFIPPPPAVPPTRTPVPGQMPPQSTGDMNQVQVEALGGPKRQFHSGTALDQGYMDSLNRQQGKNDPGYHGFHAPKPKTLGLNPGPLPPQGLPGPR